jgi:hypothetical protein
VSVMFLSLFEDTEIDNLTTHGPRGPTWDGKAVRHEMPLYAPCLSVFAGEGSLENVGSRLQVRSPFPKNRTGPEPFKCMRSMQHFRTGIPGDLLASAIPKSDIPLEIQGHYRRWHLLEELGQTCAIGISHPWLRLKVLMSRAIPGSANNLLRLLVVCRRVTLSSERTTAAISSAGAGSEYFVVICLRHGSGGIHTIRLILQKQSPHMASAARRRAIEPWKHTMLSSDHMWDIHLQIKCTNNTLWTAPDYCSTTVLYYVATNVS